MLPLFGFKFFCEAAGHARSKAEHTMVNGPRRQAFEEFLEVVAGLCKKHRLRRKLTKKTCQGDVVNAYKALLLKVHPDKGGDPDDFKRLQGAKERFDAAGNASGGRPAAPSTSPPEPERSPPKAAATDHGGMCAAPTTMVTSHCDSCPQCDAERRNFRVQCGAALFTYNGLGTWEDWNAFVAFVRADFLKRLLVLYWCATLEACKGGKWHAHLMLQFRKKINTTAAAFQVNHWKPNIRRCGVGLLGEPLHGGKHAQNMVDRGFFYVFADKLGTVTDDKGAPCVVGNYFPVWVTGARYSYAVKGLWPEALWRQRKLGHEKYEEYLVLCRDGFVGRKRALDAIKEAELQAATDAEILANTKRIKATLYKPMREFPELLQWLALFAKDAPDGMRFPILVLLAPSHCGKTELAMSLFQAPLKVQIGNLNHFPDRMRAFKRGFHDGIVVDDVRDLSFVVQHQEKFQGKYSEPVEFGSSPCGDYAYSRYLYKIPMVVTINFSTSGRELLHEDDFLGNPKNRVLFELTESPFVGGESACGESAIAVLPGQS